MTFYCHYNLSLGEITKVSPQKEKENEDDNIFVFEIPEEIALSMLSGETAPQEWTAVKPQDDTAPEPFELIRRLKNAVNKINRVDGAFLMSVNFAQMNNLADVHIIIDNTAHLLDMYVKIKSLILSSDKFFDIFITPSFDYSYLINSVKVDLSELREHATKFSPDHHNRFIRQRFKIDTELRDISISTTKIFKNVTMEIVK